MFNFNPTAQHQQSGDLIPDGYACWAVVNVRGYKHSPNTGGAYLDLELTIAAGQPLERRKLWTVVMDPSHSGNSEQGRQMGLAALQHMLEACGVLNPADPTTYQRMSTATIKDIADALHEKMVAIVVGVEKGKDGYADKNRVKKWLSPNASSPSNADFMKLMQGGAVLPAAKTAPRAPAPSGGLFTGAPPQGYSRDPGLAASMGAPAPAGQPYPPPSAVAQTPSQPAAMMPQQQPQRPAGAAPAWLQGGQG